MNEHETTREHVSITCMAGHTLILKKNFTKASTRETNEYFTLKKPYTINGKVIPK